MKYLSLDLETSGLDPKNHQILMVSAVVEDTNNIKPLEELPHYTCILSSDYITGSPYALGLNSWILDIISGRAGDSTYNKSPLSVVYQDFSDFLDKHFGSDKVTVAGKNVGGFDIPFLKEQFPGIVTRFDHRTLDPAPLCVDFVNDKTIPGLKKCMSRRGVDGEVSHDAYHDALDVIRVLRTFYTKEIKKVKSAINI